MPSYNIKQPSHPNTGQQYDVVVEGDTAYIQDGTSAIRVGDNKYVLPYKRAAAGTTQWINVFTVPKRCDTRRPLITLDLEAKSGPTSLGRPSQVQVHDAV